MNILAFETSCDETGVAIVAAPVGERPRLLKHALHTQVDMHRAYGGVVPELASRDHVQRVVPLAQQVMREAGLGRGDVSAVAYTSGPGLAGALLVGAGLAAALSCAWGVPAWPVHHLEGHLLSPFLSSDGPEFPFLVLLVSGGHTQLLVAHSVGQYQLLGETIDDAAGEAFDKSANLLGLGYPGGAALARLAEAGDGTRFKLPRPLLNRPDLDFSFSGLKTAIRTQVQRLGADLDEQVRADMAASAQAAIVEVLVHKCRQALRQTQLTSVVVVGGVSANRLLRESLLRACQAHGARLHTADLAYCTDNGAMIAMAAAMRWQAGVIEASPPGVFEIRPRWPLEELQTNSIVPASPLRPPLAT